jgi:hypothetical protein
LSAWHELVDLQKKKAELEFQLHSLEEKEKDLEEKTRVLTERLSIQEMEEHLKVKHYAVERLECKLMELERKLKEQENKQGSSMTTQDAQQGMTGYIFRADEKQQDSRQT